MIVFYDKYWKEIFYNLFHETSLLKLETLLDYSLLSLLQFSRRYFGKPLKKWIWFSKTLDISIMMIDFRPGLYVCNCTKILIYHTSEALWYALSMEQFCKFFALKSLIAIIDGLNVFADSYKEFHTWSIQDYPNFWREFWEFAEIKHSKIYEEVGSWAFWCD